MTNAFYVRQCSSSVRYAFVLRPDTLPSSFLKFIVQTGSVTLQCPTHALSN